MKLFSFVYNYTVQLHKWIYLSILWNFKFHLHLQLHCSAPQTQIYPSTVCRVFTRHFVIQIIFNRLFMVHHLISIWGTYKGLQMCIFITHTHTHTCITTHTCTHTHTQTGMRMHAHTQACTQTYMHPFTHTDMHAHLHTWHIVAHRPQDSLQEIWVFLLFLASSYTTFASVSLVKPCTTFSFFFFFLSFFFRKQP